MIDHKKSSKKKKSVSSISDQDMASVSPSGCGRMSDSDDVISGASSMGDEWSEQPQQYLIEEEIEEVEEFVDAAEDPLSTDSSNESTSATKTIVRTTLTTRPKMVTATPVPAIQGSLDCVLAELNHDDENGQQRVPFPEFGVDIVVRKDHHGLSDDDDEEMKSNVSSVDAEKTKKSPTGIEDEKTNDVSSAVICEMRTTEWEDNWLFRRQRSRDDLSSATSLRDLSLIEGTDFVAMLVPNPVEGQDNRAKIGQRDVDEVSEMSERLSEASLDLMSLVSFSSDDEDNNFEQQLDVEYTEYAVLPLRRSNLVDDEQISLDCFASLTPTNGDIEFKSVPENASIEANGKSVTFTCCVIGRKPIDVAWFHGTTLLVDNVDGRIAFLRRRNIFSLTIFDVNSTDAGNYTCLAVNPTGEKWQTFTLEVTNPSKRPPPACPPSITFSRPTKPFVESEEVTMNFEVKGQPQPRVIFIKNNKSRLQPNENVDITRSEDGSIWTLKWLRIRPRDSGLYSVRAHNSAGSGQQKFDLDVNFKPEVPRGLGKSQRSSAERPRQPLKESQHNQSVQNKPGLSDKKKQSRMPLYPHSILKKPRDPLIGLEKGVELLSSEEPVDVDAELDRPAAQPGTIADREHRKWTEQAIRLNHNPYSRESIEKRLSRGVIGDAMSPTRSNTRNGNESYFTDNTNMSDEDEDNGNNDGKEQLIFKVGSDLPRRIDCGPKSANVSRYHRDYYVQSTFADGRDVNYVAYDPPKRQTSVTSVSGVGGPGELVERTKAMLFSRQSSLPPQSTDDAEKSVMRQTSQKSDSGLVPQDQPSTSERPKAVISQRSLSIERRSDDDESSEDSERFRDSIDDHCVGDSGVGSSSEKTSTLGKVETEIFRLQREIQRAAEEKSRQIEWEKRKSSSRTSLLAGSMDSLLSVDDLPRDQSRPPTLPPKGKFVSTGSLLQSAAPALPPKQRRSLGSAPKRVAISTDEVRIIGIGGYSDDEDNDQVADDNNNHSDSSSSSGNNNKKHTQPPPDVVPQQFSRQNSNNNNNNYNDDSAKLKSSLKKKTEKVNDIPVNLPSVKELACKFLPKKSPEPMPRKLIKKCTSPPVLKDLVLQQQHRPPGFHQVHSSSREIHSLTARSVPRQFREGLRKSMPEFPDKIIKIPTTSTILSADELSPSTEQQFVDDDSDDALPSYQRDLVVVRRGATASGVDMSTVDKTGSGRVSTISNLNIIYDSQDRDRVPYPEAEIVRTPSPEHVGIPAGPLRMPPLRQKLSAGSGVSGHEENYTSDESSSVSGCPPPRGRHPPQNRRKKVTTSSHPHN